MAAALRGRRAALHLRQRRELDRRGQRRRAVRRPPSWPSAARPVAWPTTGGAHRARQRRRLRARLLAPADRARRRRRHRARACRRAATRATCSQRSPRPRGAGMLTIGWPATTAARWPTAGHVDHCLVVRVGQRAPHPGDAGRGRASSSGGACRLRSRESVGARMPTPTTARPRCSSASRRSAAAARASPTRSSRWPTAPAARPRPRSSTPCSSRRSPTTTPAPLRRRGDARRCRRGERLAFSTDSFVVQPPLVPGRLDRAPRGARHGQRPRRAGRSARRGCRPRSCIEEGFADRRAPRHRRRHGRRGRGRGRRDRHRRHQGRRPGRGRRPVHHDRRRRRASRRAATLGPELVQPGDVVLVSGTIADHGMAVMLARGDLALEADIRSDTAPLGGLVETLLAAAPAHALAARPDPRRASARCATSSPATPNLAVVLDEAALPVAPAVNGGLRPARHRPALRRQRGQAGRRRRRPTRPTPRSRALRGHPLGRARPRRSARSRAEPEGIVVLLHHVRRHPHRRHARRRSAPADLLSAGVGAHAHPGHGHRAGRRVPAVRLPARGRARPGRVRAQRQRGRAHRGRGRRAGAIAELAGALRRRPAAARPRRARSTPRRRSRVERTATAFAHRRQRRRRRARRCRSASTPRPAPTCLAEVDDPGRPPLPLPVHQLHRTADPATRSCRACPTTGPRTTMAGFAMCAACQAEYDDPADRRFHAQPNACPACGPQLAWRDLDGAALRRRRRRARRRGRRAARRRGRRGQGRRRLPPRGRRRPTRDAVGELRRRKARDDKPFAVMVARPRRRPSAVRARRRRRGRADVVAAAADRARSAPTADAPVADGVAPGLPELGLMLAVQPAAPPAAGGRRPARS